MAAGSSSSTDGDSCAASSESLPNRTLLCGARSGGRTRFDGRGNGVTVCVDEEGVTLLGALTELDMCASIMTGDCINGCLLSSSYIIFVSPSLTLTGLYRHGSPNWLSYCRGVPGTWLPSFMVAMSGSRVHRSLMSSAVKSLAKFKVADEAVSSWQTAVAVSVSTQLTVAGIVVTVLYAVLDHFLKCSIVLLQTPAVSRGSDVSSTKEIHINVLLSPKSHFLYVSPGLKMVNKFFFTSKLNLTKDTNKLAKVERHMCQFLARQFLWFLCLST